MGYVQYSILLFYLCKLNVRRWAEINIKNEIIKRHYYRLRSLIWLAQVWYNRSVKSLGISIMPTAGLENICFAWL